MTADPDLDARSGPPAAPSLPELLLTLRRAAFTGSVLISGTPGGTIRLEQGLVTAVETPGAPAVGTLLLKSGRIGEAQWAAAEAAAGSTEPGGGHADLGAVLVAQGAIGAAELETVCAAAVFDGAFALALGLPGSWQVAEADLPARIALRPGVDPGQLAEETARRMSLLTRLGSLPQELAAVRIRPSERATAPTARISARHRDIVVAATGRRTARDLAFALGRGVFAVMLDLVRMDAGRLLHREAAPAAPGVPSVAPRTPPDGPPPISNGPLPRRVRGEQPPGAQAARPAHPVAVPAEPTALTEKSEKTAP
ncbi:hypothetical protein ACIQF6_00585 [Kitasatospora sp. NPDC092948]|uniref:hypothetical protein n=1 Tax=Kitasatospora sp. NPDC092948 TaxID=3364088 RepID=UPI0038024181